MNGKYSRNYHKIRKAKNQNQLNHLLHVGKFGIEKVRRSVGDQLTVNRRAKYLTNILKYQHKFRGKSLKFMKKNNADRGFINQTWNNFRKLNGKKGMKSGALNKQYHSTVKQMKNRTRHSNNGVKG